MSSLSRPFTIPRRSMRVATATSLLLTSLMAGCANYSKDHFVVGAVPDDYRNRHPIVVAENEVTEDIPVSANMKSLSYRDRRVVEDFASRFRRSKGRHMQLAIPSQSTNEVAARKISAVITSALISRGVQPSQITKTYYHAGGYSAVAPIRMSFLALSADVGECGKWEDNIAGMETNRNYANFGCATQNNLAKMVANPADLVGPRAPSEIDAGRRDTVITDWRENGSPTLNAQF